MQLPHPLRKKLAHVDVASAYVRHITEVMADDPFHQVNTALDDILPGTTSGGTDIFEDSECVIDILLAGFRHGSHNGGMGGAQQDARGEDDAWRGGFWAELGGEGHGEGYGTGYGKGYGNGKRVTDGLRFVDGVSVGGGKGKYGDHGEPYVEGYGKGYGKGCEAND